MNQLCYFEIQSSNPAREISFYQYVFAWTFTEVKGLPIQYYQIETQGIHGGLLEVLQRHHQRIVAPMPLPVVLKLKISTKSLREFWRKVVKLPWKNLR